MGYRRWASRYFVLNVDEGTLRWFNSKDDYERDQKENEPVAIKERRVEEIGDDAFKIHEREGEGETGDRGDKTFHLKALTKEERNEWVVKLRTATSVA